MTADQGANQRNAVVGGLVVDYDELVRSFVLLENRAHAAREIARIVAVRQDDRNAGSGSRADHRSGWPAKWLRTSAPATAEAACMGGISSGASRLDRIDVANGLGS